MKFLIVFIYENINNYIFLENFFRYLSFINLLIFCFVIFCFCSGVYIVFDVDDCIFFVIYKLRGNLEVLVNSGRVVLVYVLVFNY